MRKINNRYEKPHIKSNSSINNRSLAMQSTCSQLDKNMLKNKSLVLNGYNIMANKFEREKKVLSYVPLLELRTFGQLRKHFLNQKKIVNL